MMMLPLLTSLIAVNLIQGKTLPPPIWKYLAKAPRDGEIGKFLEKAPKDRNIWKYLAKAPKDGIIGKFLDGIFGKFLAKAPRDKRLLRYLFFCPYFAPLKIALKVSFAHTKPKSI